MTHSDTWRRKRPSQWTASGRWVARLLTYLASFIIGIGLWQLIAASSIFPHGLLPGIGQVASALRVSVTHATLWHAVADTTSAALLGLGVATVVGLVVGILVGLNRWLFRYTRTTLELLRPVPPPALIPVIVLLLGTGFEAKVFLVLFGCIFPILIAATDGVRDVEPLMLDTARSYGASRSRRFYAVVLPAALPFVLGAIRLAASISLLVAVAFELISGSPGLGQEINLAANGGQSNVMYAYIVVSGILGIALNGILLALQRRLLGWTPAERGV